jgi:hypothetical protein
VREAASRDGGTDGRTDGGGGVVVQEHGPVAVSGGDAAAADAAPEERSSGGEGSLPGPAAVVRPVELAAPTAEAVAVLAAVAAAEPLLTLSGRPHTDQARRIDGLLAAGYRPEALAGYLGAPIGEIRTSPGAVVSSRISQLPPVPHRSVPTQGGAAAPLSGADRHQDVQQPVRPPARECADCGRPGVEAGYDRCARCMDWPTCTTCTGLTPRRADPAGDGRCSSCATEQAAYTDRETDWKAAIARATAAVEAQEGQQQAHTPA